LEVSELPGLLAQYGRNFSKIADFFKTKTTEDVEERFRTLVESGRQDLAELVSNADARLRAQQEEENAMLLDTNTSDLTKFSPNLESGMDADTPDEGYSRLQSGSPALMFPDSAEAVPYFPFSEATSAYQSQRNSGASKVSSQKQLGQDSEDVSRPKKYKRRAPPPAFCPHCKIPLRDEYTFIKHNARFHSPFRKVWICIDVSIDKNMLANCQSCRSGIRFSAKHNAATHLRKKHFGPKASMETLSRWMEEVEEPNPQPPR
jgi:hypothetical protein